MYNSWQGRRSPSATTNRKATRRLRYIKILTWRLIPNPRKIFKSERSEKGDAHNSSPTKEDETTARTNKRNRYKHFLANRTEQENQQQIEKNEKTIAKKALIYHKCFFLSFFLSFFLFFFFFFFWFCFNNCPMVVNDGFSKENGTRKLATDRKERKDYKLWLITRLFFFNICQNFVQNGQKRY